MSEPTPEENPEPTTELFNQFFIEFDHLRQERMTLIQGIPDDPDLLLADIANMASLIYVIRKLMPSMEQFIPTTMEQPQGFQSFATETKEDER